MNSIEGILRTDKIYLYEFCALSAIVNLSTRPECISCTETDGVIRVRIASEKKFSDSFLSENKGKFLGVYSSVKIFGTGMRGSSDILCRAIKLIRKNSLAYALSSMCESSIVFIMKEKDAKRLFDVASEEFDIKMS